jgi:hypothetical protein
MAIRGRFFDLYGTLLVYDDMLRAWSRWLTALHECLARRGLPMSQESLALNRDGFF